MFALCAVADTQMGYGCILEEEGSKDKAPGVMAVWDERLRGVPCQKCQGLQEEAHMIVCDRCESCWHTSCGEDGGRNPVHDGLWYCGPCRGHIVLHGFQDVT